MASIAGVFTGPDLRPSWLFHFNGEHVVGPNILERKTIHCMSGVKLTVGLKALVVLGHVHETVGMKEARLDESRQIDICALDDPRMKQLDSLASACATWPRSPPSPQKSEPSRVTLK